MTANKYLNCNSLCYHKSVKYIEIQYSTHNWFLNSHLKYNGLALTD